MIRVTKYQALDGTLFDTASACQKYAENRAYKLTNSVVNNMNHACDGKHHKTMEFIKDNIGMFLEINNWLNDAVLQDDDE